MICLSGITFFVERLKALKFQLNHVLVSFDIVSLFTMVLVNEVIEHIKQIFPNDISTCADNNLFPMELLVLYIRWMVLPWEVLSVSLWLTFTWSFLKQKQLIRRLSNPNVGSDMWITPLSSGVMGMKSLTSFFPTSTA